MYAPYPVVSDLVGKTLKAIRNDDSRELYFETEDGKTFKLYHSQDCCESVYIEDIAGDLQDLIGSPLVIAAEVTGETPADFDPAGEESYTWTFYKFATIKGYVDIRWFGSSNGYYSEGVDFAEVA